MPLFDFREASPSSDKENSSDLHITDYSPWGTLYRNPPPELAMPMLKNKSRLKKGKNNKMMPDSLMGPKSTRRKKDQLMPLNFDSPGSRGLRGTSHMGMARELSSMELPDSLIGSESVAPDWRPFEDWQIVMTSAMLQGVPQNPQQVLPTVTATSCELTSYVTSTVNPKYRQSRECQLRLRAIRTREEKDSSGDVVAPPKKKKKTKLEETLAVDKTMFPVPKRAVQALQEDNGRSRTQLYRDFFSAFRSQTYNPPSQRRESSANQRAGAGAWSSSVFLESGIALDDPVTPLTMLKRKMDRSSMSKNFVTETAYRWAQTMNMTVDAHGQRAETHLLSPQQKSNSILQQTLQAAAPRTPTAANMPLLSAVVAGTAAPAQTPLPSPQYMAMGTGIPSAVRRQVQFPSTNSPSPAPPSSSPLPSIGSTSLTQFIGNQPIAGKTIPVQINTINVPTPPVVNNTSETAVVPSSSLPVAVQSAVAPNTQQQQAPPAAAPPRGPQEQLSVDRARQLQVLRNIFTLPRGQQTFTGQDLARIREYLSNRGIQFSDAQLSDLVRAFASKTGAGGAPTQTAAPAMVDGGGAGGGGVQTYQVVQQQQQPQQQQVTITGPGNQMVQAPAVLTAVSSGPRQLNYRGVVRGAQSTGPATISLNFAQMQSSQIQQPQAPQTIRPQIVNTTKRVAVSSALPLAANKNGPITIPQGKPAAAVMTSQNVAILPNPNRTGLPPVNMNPDQVKQATYYNPRLANVITSTPGESLSLRRQMTPITIPIATGQPGQMQPVYIQFAVDNKPIIPDPAATAASKRDQNSTPPTPGSGSLPEPN